MSVYRIGQGRMLTGITCLLEFKMVAGAFHITFDIKVFTADSSDVPLLPCRIQVRCLSCFQYRGLYRVSSHPKGGRLVHVRDQGDWRKT